MTKPRRKTSKGMTRKVKSKDLKQPKTSQHSRSREHMILNRLAMSPDEYPNVYWIGRKAMRLTFLSQQHRALNLIWALHRSKKLRPKSRVTVVGAGLAGMTAAFAASQLGATVTLIEEKQVPLHLQLGCWLRFVHPHILNWPDKNSENPLTDLPCLNWGADMAARICNTILEQWSAVEKTVQTYYGFQVRRISMSRGIYPLVFAEGNIVGESMSQESKGKIEEPKSKVEELRAKTEDRRGNYEKECDCLILAVGFGLEKPLPSVPFLSYWENDNFGRPLITGPIPRRYLVSGCGDGGLIDAIRLSLNAFDHADFVYSLSNMGGLDEIKAELLRIDAWLAKAFKADRAICDRIENLVAQAKTRSTGLSFDESRARKRIEIELQGEMLEEKYRELKIPQPLKELITTRLRPDTIVYLNSPSTSPLSLGASILNRFVVFLLRTYGFLRYRAGEVEVAPITAGQPFRVYFNHEQFPREELEVHEIVVRHGPIPAIDRLFPKHIVDAARVLPTDFDDPTREPQYKTDKDFLISPLTEEQKRKVAQNYALASISLAAKRFFPIGSYDRFGVEVAQGKVSFIRRPLSVQSPESEHQESFFGIQIHSDPPAKIEPPSVVTPAKYPDVVCGIGISNIGQKSQPRKGQIKRKSTLGTLGCFVRLKANKELALLTTSFALGGSEIAVGDRIVLAGQDQRKEPRVIASVTTFRLAEPSTPRSSVAAGTVVYNQFDAAIATLGSGIKPHIGFGEAFRRAPALKYDPNSPFTDDRVLALVGSEVFKVGAATGLTRGIIEGVLASVEIRGFGEQYWYENIITISSAGKKPFGSSGDGGALVIQKDGTVLGMIIGGGESLALVCPIGPILDAFECLPILSDSEL